MNGPRDYHTKQQKPEKTNIIWCHLYVESKKKDRNEFIYKTELDSQSLFRKQAYQNGMREE